jgi:hypothetical protein
MENHFGYYRRCPHCGFVVNQYVVEMEQREWERLNATFHRQLERGGSIINQPPYAEQAMMIKFLGANGVINTLNMIDYAAGFGTLSRIMHKYYWMELQAYDLYLNSEVLPTCRDLVVNSAMFEHVRSRKDLDDVNACVSSDGALLIHTVVVENVPTDPNWFYFIPPVHCAFHTNKSMAILMEQWGYKSSIYSPKAKSWLLLKGEASQYARDVSQLNKELKTEWFILKDNFVDYWKGNA